MKGLRIDNQNAINAKVAKKHQREADYMDVLYKYREDLNEYWKAENEANMNHSLTMRDKFQRQKEYRNWVQEMKNQSGR